MNNSFMIGRYIKGNSFIHKIDPRIKIIILTIILTMIFISGGYETYIYLTCLVATTFLLSGLPFKLIIKQWKTILFIFIFIFLLSCLTINTIKPNVNPISIGGALKINPYALINSSYITWRILLMIVTTLILVSTTKPLHLTLAIEDLLFPLKFFRLPTSEISMMISISFRFIPTFLQEADTISKAQASRGIDLRSKNPKDKIIGLTSLIIPLFLSSFQKAEDLANAMDIRGYVPGQKRTRGTRLKLRIIDIILLIIVIEILVIVILTANGILPHWLSTQFEPTF